MTGLETAPFIGTEADNYLDEMVPAKEDCGIHLPSSDVQGYSFGDSVSSAGGWAYFADASSNVRVGKIVVNCIQTDTKGTVISTW